MNACDIVKELWTRIDQLKFNSLKELLHQDLIIHWPQSKETIQAPENYIAINENYPTIWKMDIEQVCETSENIFCRIRMSHKEQIVFAFMFYNLKEEKIISGTEYFADCFPPQEWRAKWVSTHA